MLGSKFKPKLGHYSACNLDLNARSSPACLCQLPHCWVNACYLRFKLSGGVWVTAGRVTIYPCCPLTGTVVLAIICVCVRSFVQLFGFKASGFTLKVGCWLSISVFKNL